MWIHDSYRLVDGTVADWFSQHGGNTHNLSGVDGEAWAGQGSMGPFLRTGDMFTDRLTLVNGEDVRIRMAFPAQPEPAVVDDLQLRVRLQDGTILLPDRLRSGGFAPTEFYPMWWTRTTQRRFPQATRPSSVLTSPGVISTVHRTSTLTLLHASCSRVARKAPLGWTGMRSGLLLR